MALSLHQLPTPFLCSLDRPSLVSHLPILPSFPPPSPIPLPHSGYPPCLDPPGLRHHTTLTLPSPGPAPPSCPAPLPLTISLLSSSKRPPPASPLPLALHFHASLPSFLSVLSLQHPFPAPRLTGTLFPHCPSQLPPYLSPPSPHPRFPLNEPSLRSNCRSCFSRAPAPSFSFPQSLCPCLWSPPCGPHSPGRRSSAPPPQATRPFTAAVPLLSGLAWPLLLGVPSAALCSFSTPTHSPQRPAPGIGPRSSPGGLPGRAPYLGLRVRTSGSLPGSAAKPLDLAAGGKRRSGFAEQGGAGGSGPHRSDFGLRLGLQLGWATTATRAHKCPAQGRSPYSPGPQLWAGVGNPRYLGGPALPNIWVTIVIYLNSHASFHTLNLLG